jgi:hypothetical protein
MAFKQINDRVYEMTAEEEAQLAADQQASLNEMLPIWNRAKRNQLLADSDWTQMNDSPLTNELKTSWATYRQSLRDITADESWPDVTFPATP